MDRNKHSSKNNAPKSSGASTGAAALASGKDKAAKGGKKPIKVVYISNPMRVKTSAADFRALVQELTGRDADPSKYVDVIDADGGAAGGGDEGAPRHLGPGAAAAASLYAAGPAAEGLVGGGGGGGGDDEFNNSNEDDDGGDSDGFKGPLLDNSYSVFSPPTLLYDHHKV